MLIYMLDHRATGTAILGEPDGSEHAIYFVAGAPARVRTGRSVALLGEELLHAGLITPMTLASALVASRKAGQRLGEYLVTAKLVSHEDVVLALERQVIGKIVALVNLPAETSYRFFKGRNLIEDWGGAELFPQHPLWVIVAAARAWEDRSRIEARFRGAGPQAWTAVGCDVEVLTIDPISRLFSRRFRIASRSSTNCFVLE